MRSAGLMSIDALDRVVLLCRPVGHNAGIMTWALVPRLCLRTHGPGGSAARYEAEPRNQSDFNELPTPKTLCLCHQKTSVSAQHQTTLSIAKFDVVLRVN